MSISLFLVQTVALILEKTAVGKHLFCKRAKTVELVTEGRKGSAVDRNKKKERRKVARGGKRDNSTLDHTSSHMPSERSSV